jgi:cysteine desulfurase
MDQSGRSYFDWNATAPLRPQARAAMQAALERTGNASSIHSEGRAARALVEAARAQVAALVGAEPGNVTFTSGGTEANMLALTPALTVGGRPSPRDRLLVSAIEHPSVRAGGRFAAVELVGVSADGGIDLELAANMLAGAGKALVSVMLANNETGVIQPIREVAEIVHAAGGLLHVDAVQGAGRIDCDINELGADLMTVSSHKLGGPQGVGALVTNGNVLISQPLIVGGGQERGQRAGTENVAAIAGFGAAAAAAQASRAREAAAMAALRTRLEVALTTATPTMVIIAATAPRLPNTTLFAVPGMKAETAIISFDLNGIAVSSGAACSSGKVQASPVLAAMGLDPALAHGAVRVSLGWTTTEIEVENLLNAWIKVASSLFKDQGIAA